MAKIDKIDVIEYLSEALDDKVIPGLGFVLASADFENDGILVLQTWPDGDNQPSVDFLLRVSKAKKFKI